MPNLGDLIVRVVGDNAEFDKSIDSSEKKLQAFSRNAERIGKNLTKFVTVPLVGMATAAVKFAIDAEETSAKFRTAFRGIEKQADRTAKNLVDNFGLSQTQAERLLSGTGDLLKGFGATAEQALGLSDQVQQLAVDLASYNNIQGGASRASEILTKAMLGEREALTSLGIKISETEVQQKLMEKGQEDLTGQALLLAKAQATLELAMEQSGDAMGDFERTSDSAANQLRIAGAKAKDVAVSFGNILLPAVTELLGKVNDLADRFLALDEDQRKVILTVAGVVAAIGPATLAIGKLAGAMKTLKLVSTALFSPTGLIVAAAVAIGAVTAKYIAFKRAQRNSNRVMNENNEIMRGTKILITEIATEIGKSNEQRISELELLKAKQIALVSQREAELASAESLKAHGYRVLDMTGKYINLTEAEKRRHDAAIPALEEQVDALNESINTIDDAIEAQRKLNEATSGVGGADEGTDSGSEGKKTWEEYLAQVRSVLAAQLEQIEATDRAREVTGEFFDAVAEKKDVVRDAIESLLAPTEDLTGQFTAASPAVQALLDDLIELGATEEEIAEARAEEEERRRQADAEAEARGEAAHAAMQQRLQDNMSAWNKAYEARKKSIEELRKKEEEAHKDRISEALAFKDSTFDTLDAILAASEAFQKRRIDQTELTEKQIAELEYKAAMNSWSLSLTKAIVAGAIATVNAFATQPFIPNGLAMGILAGIKSAAEVATVAANKPSPPALAQGGIVTPTPGGTIAQLAEAGQAEVVFPLDRLEEFLSQRPGSAYSGGMAGGQTRLVVNIDSKPILDQIFDATRNRTVIIDGGAVV